MNDPALHVVKIQQLAKELREYTADASKPEDDRLAMIQVVTREIMKHRSKDAFQDDRKVPTHDPYKHRCR